MGVGAEGDGYGKDQDCVFHVIHLLGFAVDTVMSGGAPLAGVYPLNGKPLV